MTRKPARYVAQVIRPQFPVFLTLLWYAIDTLLANDQIKLLAVIGCLPCRMKSETEGIWKINWMHEGLCYYLGEIRSLME